jgi:hypothetical protein
MLDKGVSCNWVAIFGEVTPAVLDDGVNHLLAASTRLGSEQDLLRWVDVSRPRQRRGHWWLTHEALRMDGVGRLEHRRPLSAALRTPGGECAGPGPFRGGEEDRR